MIADLGPAHPRLHPTTWLAPGATVIGQVTTEAEVSIWFGAILRGDSDLIAIGRQSNIQDGVVIHVDSGFPCRVGASCVVGHRAVLHGCTLGDQVLVGIGAIVMNGAVVPDGCWVGAGALVPEGQVLESDSLYLGVPARRVRSISTEERERVQAMAQGYVERARRYRAELWPRLDV